MDITPENKSLTFESDKGPGKNKVQCSYTLTLNSNKKFHLIMHLFNQDKSREEYDYVGDYLATYTRGDYVFTFSNVVKSGSRRKTEQSNPEPVAPSTYDKPITGLLPEGGNLELKKNQFQIFMKLLDTATCVDFLDSVFPETCLLDTAGEWKGQYVWGYDFEFGGGDKSSEATHKACGCFSYSIPGNYITVHKRGEIFVHNQSPIVGKCKYCEEDTN